MKNVNVLILTVALLCPVLLFAGNAAGAKVYGKPVAEVNAVTRISDILARPAEFEGKMVKVEGKIIQECPSGCWFKLNDASGTIHVNIKPSNLVIPQVLGQKAVAVGMVKKEGLNVSLVGSGVEI